jgi:hypothetical protein
MVGEAAASEMRMLQCEKLNMGDARFPSIIPLFCFQIAPYLTMMPASIQESVVEESKAFLSALEWQ